jgi:hypothetical protein
LNPPSVEMVRPNESREGNAVLSPASIEMPQAGRLEAPY